TNDITNHWKEHVTVIRHPGKATIVSILPVLLLSVAETNQPIKVLLETILSLKYCKTCFPAGFYFLLIGC
ncbi:MAG: hypothetical protein JRN67_13605, partial [Nitrososphaerota archaeon]|nr:hypothetical protein [Nitrososphaerota archaeon]